MQQQQQQQAPAVPVDTARPVLTRSRLENDSPTASANSTAARKTIRPASGALTIPQPCAIKSQMPLCQLLHRCQPLSRLPLPLAFPLPCHPRHAQVANHNQQHHLLAAMRCCAVFTLAVQLPPRYRRRAVGDERLHRSAREPRSNKNQRSTRARVARSHCCKQIGSRQSSS